MEIRGVWITTTNSTVLNERKNIAESMKFLADTGFNVVFPVVWNNGTTNYPSQVMKEKFGIEIKDLKEFKGRDPLRELIEEAKKFDIAVIPWLEYGFKSSYGQKGGKILEKKPEWAALGFDRQFLVINGFYWLNSLDSEVQDFLSSLFLEIINKYGDGIVGIQGDDNFLALPMEGGYDDKTIKRYQDVFNEQPPKPPERRSPQKPPDPQWQNPQWKQWVRWRADILSHYLNSFYRKIIKINPELIISLSPSIYPWGYENYLQDSQTWVDLGLVDLIHPQVYREKIEDYKNEINRIKKTQFNQQQSSQLIPGVLLNKKGTYLIKPQDLIEVIKYNRDAGIQGEVLFFYEGLREKDPNNNNITLAEILQSSVYSEHPGKFDPKEIKKNTFTQRRINNYTYLNISQTPETDPKIPLHLFDWIEPFSEDIAAVKIGYKWGYIDKTGKLIGRVEYDSAAPFTEGLGIVNINNKYGYIDKTGKRITDLKFDNALSFSQGMAAVKIGNQWVYIESTGKTIIPPTFTFVDAKSFSEDLAAIKILNKWGYINKLGQAIIPSQFDDAGNFAQGFASVKVGNQWGYVDKSGNFLIKPQFEEVDIFAEELAPVKITGKWGYINQFGEFIIPPNFDFAKPFSEGLALINVAGKWGYIRKP